MGIEQIKVKINPDVQPTGSDLAVVNAARRSFNTRSDWDYHHDIGLPPLKYLKDKDKRLIEFLARGMTADDFDQFVRNVPAPDTEDHAKELVHLLWEWRNTPIHDTPFNHCFLSFEVQAPIFVRAQLVKHEYLIMSEFSRRYITDDIQFYKPDHWRAAAENKKQGSGDNLDWDPALYSYEFDLSQYKFLIGNGAAPEQARMVLPQSTMTEWTWSGTLGAFAKMCQLRLHPDAQYEARVVAQQVYDYLKQYYPVSAVALVEGVR